MATQGVKDQPKPAFRKMQNKPEPDKTLPSVTDAPSIKLVPKPWQAPRPPIITGSAKPSPYIKPPK
jgi:hypothetical protein